MISFILAAIIIWFLVIALCKKSDAEAAKSFYKGDIK